MECDTESTATSIEENTENLCDNPIRDTLVEGLMGLLKPTVDRLDEGVRATRISQAELKQQIDGLAEELKKISDCQSNNLELDGYVKKLTHSKQKISIVASMLQSTQERLDKIHHLVAREAARRKALIEAQESASSSGFTQVSQEGNIN